MQGPIGKKLSGSTKVRICIFMEKYGIWVIYYAAEYEEPHVGRVRQDCPFVQGGKGRRKLMGSNGIQPAVAAT